MSKLTLYDKSDKYGDLHKGYFVCEAVSYMVKGIDLRNPATVKFARLLLGNREAVRDSIDDIASYAKKTNNELSFEPDSAIPDDVMVVLDVAARFCEAYNPSPTTLAYVIAFLSAIRRKEYLFAISLLNELDVYNSKSAKSRGQSQEECSSLLIWAEYIANEVAKIAIAQPPVAQPPVAQPPVAQPPVAEQFLTARAQNDIF